MSVASKPFKILWADDEIDLLKPHILFLQQKGYEVLTALSGSDALDLLQEEAVDLVFLDENMPGLSGLETLEEIHRLYPYTPIVMVTKSEEEQLMHQALAENIADYLIKPVNPTQLLLTLKKLLQRNDIIDEATVADYQQAFRETALRLMQPMDIEDWKRLYKELSERSLKIQEMPQLKEMHAMQWKEVDTLFARFVRENYRTWLMRRDRRPLMSPDLMTQRVFPLIDRGEKVFFILIDNFRFDQWLAIKDLLGEHFTIQEELYTSILPTATQYARNAIFSGMMPIDIARRFPELWVDEEDERSKNLNEEPLVETLLQRNNKAYNFSYYKINNSREGEKLLASLDNLSSNALNILVLNFVDILSHTRTESKMMRELAADEAAYRSLTLSWFKHSTTLRLFLKIAQMGYRIVLTTDHGSIRVQNPIRVVGDKNTSTNLRYKWGRHLSYDSKEVFAITKPHEYGLPTSNITDTYIFSWGNRFFTYPNNFNYYVNYYRDTFQHGGISMEEMLVPFITLSAK